jgi:hypothetical protein
MNKWYCISDMYSGGYRKTEFNDYYVEAPTGDAARARFTEITGEDTDAIACKCCGENFGMYEVDSPKSGGSVLVLPADDKKPLLSIEDSL